MNLRTRLVLLSAVFLTGCATTERGQREVHVPPAGNVQTQPQPELPPIQAQPLPPAGGGVNPGQPLTSHPRSLADSKPGPAVMTLYQQAQQQVRDHRNEQAEASLERALGIAPRNPFVWQALANLHLRMGQYDRAATEVQRSNSLGHDNPFLEIGNWRTLAAVRRAQGDAAGALQAQSQADDLTRALNATPP
ncbi:MAG: hypothetical protein KGJ55_03290 [Gammaproteobacteria bacterium]|nr:hypothetical protein [Gammaproteobacteria bacterium]